MAKFKSVNPDGGGVTVWGDGPEIRVPTDGVYETDDKDEIAALRANALLVEVKEAKAETKRVEASEVENKATQPKQAETKERHERR